MSVMFMVSLYSSNVVLTDNISYWVPENQEF